MSRNVLCLKRPASVNKEMWKTGLPIGNGITGALAFGAISEDTLIITRHDLWHARKNYNPVPDVSSEFVEMRKKVADGDYNGACNIMYNALKGKGYPSFTGANQFPLGAITLNFLHDGVSFKNYRRGIDMEMGYAFIKWRDEFGDHLKRIFVSRDDGILYYNVRSSQKCAYNLDFGVYDNRDASTENEINLRADKEKLEYSKTSIYYFANVDGQGFGAHVWVEINDDGFCCKADGNGLYIESSDFTIKLLSFAKSDADTTLIDKSPDFTTALKRHSALHSEIFNRVSIELTSDNDELSEATNEELIDIAYDDTAPLMLYEKLWRFGRYLFVSAWDKESNPFPLYGLWAGSYDLPWNCHVCNINVEMIYWHVLCGDMAFCLKNLIHYFYEKIDCCRDNAQKLFGCRGIYVPTYSTPETMDGKNLTPPTPILPVTLNWISGAGWLSNHFYQYYIYTHDTETLNSEIIPFMIETAKFYEDYILFDENGKCKFSPSVSPENTPKNLIKDKNVSSLGHPCPVTVNSTMDIAVLKDFMTHFMELISLPECTVAIDDESLKKWRKILSAIPDYMINEDGAVKEWMSNDLDDNYDHRHFSHLFPIFPGDEISKTSSGGIYDSFRKAAEMRLAKAQSGWSFAFLACFWTRYGQGNRALDNLATMIKGCLLDNFFTLHNDWRHMGASIVVDSICPVQLDALMGSVSAIQDMILQYNKQSLFILPALPDAFTYINAHGLRIPEGKVDIMYDKGITEVSVLADYDCELTVHYNSFVIPLSLKKGQIKSVRF